MNPQIRTIIACLCIGLIAGWLCNASHHSPVPHTVAREHPDQSLSKLHVQQQAFEAARAQLLRRGDSLERQIAYIRQRLETATNSNEYWRTTAQKLITERSLLQDTPAVLQNCDSIAESTIHLIEAHRHSDSLYEMLLQETTLKATVCDSLLLRQQQRMAELQTNSLQCYEEQKEVLEENRQLRRQLRKEGRRQKLLSGVALAAGAVAAWLLVVNR